MSKRNIAWLVVIVGIGVVVGVVAGWVWGLPAAVVVLVISEVVERRRRRRRRAERGAAPDSPVRGALGSRRSGR